MADNMDDILSGKKVLVVDDYSINLELMKEMLEMFECDIELAEDGYEAIEKANTRKYDIIFMDVQMPEMNGYEATTEIKKGVCNRDTPVIALTAKALNGDKERCFAAGMSDYITKPVKLRSIEEVIMRYPSKRIN